MHTTCQFRGEGCLTWEQTDLVRFRPHSCHHGCMRCGVGTIPTHRLVVIRGDCTFSLDKCPAWSTNILTTPDAFAASNASVSEDDGSTLCHRWSCDDAQWSCPEEGLSYGLVSQLVGDKCVVVLSVRRSVGRSVFRLLWGEIDLPADHKRARARRSLCVFRRFLVGVD